MPLIESLEFYFNRHFMFPQMFNYCGCSCNILHFEHCLNGRTDGRMKGRVGGSSSYMLTLALTLAIVHLSGSFNRKWWLWECVDCSMCMWQIVCLFAIVCVCVLCIEEEDRLKSGQFNYPINQFETSFTNALKWSWPLLKALQSIAIAYTV